MKISRRTFIKSAVAVIGVALVPGQILDKVNKSSRNILKEYGKAVPVVDKINKKQITEIVEKVLLFDARKTMGKGVVIEIRMKIPSDFGRNNGIAWYTNNIIMSKRPEKISKPVLNTFGGYIYCGRIRT